MVWLGPENEASPPAQEAPASQSPRLPCPHVNTWRCQGDQGPPPQGPSPPDANLQPAGAVTLKSSGGWSGALGCLASPTSTGRSVPAAGPPPTTWPYS